MKTLSKAAALLICLGCGQKFEPDLNGYRAYVLPGRPLIHIEIDGKERMITLPGDEHTIYRYPQWTRSRDQFLMVQIVSREKCSDYGLIAVDTTGAIVDTVYTPPPNTAANLLR